MNINTLIGTIRDAIHDDSSLQTWCTTNYGRNHKVYSGIDMRDPPGESDCPLVSITKASKNIGYDLERISYGIEIQCQIFDDDSRTITGKTNVVELESVQNIETFRKYVETATETAIDSNYTDITVSDVRIMYEDIEFFPFLICAMVWNLTEDYYQGGDVYA